MNVYQKLNLLRGEVSGFSRDGANKGLSYTYTTASQIFAKTKQLMVDNGLVLVPLSTEHRSSYQFDYTTSSGKSMTDFIVEGKLSYALVNVDDPSDRHIIDWQYYGQQDDISKAFGSALTYSERYILLKLLGLPTDEDDPDNTDTSGKNGNKQEKKRPSSNQYGQVLDLIKGTKINLNDVATWIQVKFKQDIKINDLTESEFNELMTALRKKLNE